MNNPLRQTTEETESFVPQLPLETKTGVSPKAPGEFKITVRKLEIPVRPRGVLAE